MLAARQKINVLLFFRHLKFSFKIAFLCNANSYEQKRILRSLNCFSSCFLMAHEFKGCSRDFLYDVKPYPEVFEGFRKQLLHGPFGPGEIVQKQGAPLMGDPVSTARAKRIIKMARCLLAAASLLLLVRRGAACGGPRSGRREWMKIMRERNRFLNAFCLCGKTLKDVSFT